MNPGQLLNQYQVILELEALGAWYLASILRKSLKQTMEVYYEQQNK